MEDQSGYFTMLERLVASLPLSAETVGDALGVRLQREPDTGGPAARERWQGESADPDGPLESVALSLPGPFGGETSLLSLVLRSSRGVTRRQVIERLGPEFDFHPPSPGYPAGAVPAYLVYAQPWGELRIGVSVEADGLLREIVMQVPVHPAADEPETLADDVS
jgi:hypothetical protein